MKRFAKAITRSVLMIDVNEIPISSTVYSELSQYAPVNPMSTDLKILSYEGQLLIEDTNKLLALNERVQEAFVEIYAHLVNFKAHTQLVDYLTFLDYMLTRLEVIIVALHGKKDFVNALRFLNSVSKIINKIAFSFSDLEDKKVQSAIYHLKDVSLLFLILRIRVSIDANLLDKALVLINKGFNISNEMALDGKAYLRNGSLYTYLAKVYSLKNDLSFAQEAIESANDCFTKFKDVCVDYIPVCQKLVKQYIEKKDYTSAIKLLNSIVKVSRKKFTKAKILEINQSINLYQQKHQDLIKQFISKQESPIYQIKVDGDEISIKILDKDFQVSCKPPFTRKRDFLFANIYDISVTQLSKVLIWISTQYETHLKDQDHKSTYAKLIKESSERASKNPQIERKKQSDKIENHSDQSENIINSNDIEVKEGKQEIKLDDKREIKATQKAEIKSSQDQAQRLSQAEALGFDAQYANRKLYPIKSYVNKTPYWAYYDSTNAYNKEETALHNYHSALLEKGAGHGVEMVGADTFKTRVGGRYTKFSNFRMWSVVKQEVWVDGERRVLLAFENARNHNSQQLEYKKLKK